MKKSVQTGLTAIFLLTFSLRAMAQEPAEKPPELPPLRLNEIKFEGLQKYDQEAVTKITELKLNEKVDLNAIKAAMRKLVLTGYFSKVNYRYAYDDERIDLLIIVQEREAEEGVPCIFDNLVWLTDKEIREAIRQEIPYYEGRAPQNNVVLGKIKVALERKLKERRLPSEIDFQINEAFTLFVVKDAGLPVCAVQFSGNAAVSGNDLQQASKLLLTTDYSRQYLPGFATENLLPLYRKRGYLRAKFSLNEVKPGETSGKCKNGVLVRLSVQEGNTYLWNKADWQGNQVFSADALDKLLGMKNGDVADGLKFDNGIKSVVTAYGRQGYVQVRLTPAVNFDDVAQKVSVTMSLNEGSQFRMGQLIFTGVSESDVKKLRDKWKLKTGDVYDVGYLEEFSRLFYEGKLGIRAATIDPRVNANSQMLTVDVTISFK